MVLPIRFNFYLVFCVIVVLSAFGLSPSYCDVWFVIALLRRVVVYRLVATFYLCGSDSDRQDIFDQLKILNYGRQHIEKLESNIC